MLGVFESRWGRALLLLLSVHFLVACATSSGRLEGEGWEKAQQEPSDILNQARTAQSLAKTNEALFYYATYLEHDPKNAEVLMQVGEIHLAKKNLDLAQVALDMSLESNPNLAKTHEVMGLLMMQRHEANVARAEFQKAVELDPHLWRAQNGLGMLADQDRKFDQAEAAYRAALAANPKNPLVMNNLSYSLYLKGGFEAALEAANAALSFDAKYEPAILNRGLYLLRLGRHDEALADLKLVQSDADAYSNLGYFLMQDGDWVGARAYFEKAIAVSPHYHELAQENLKVLSRLEDAAVRRDALGAQSTH